MPLDILVVMEVLVVVQVFLVVMVVDLPEVMVELDFLMVKCQLPENFLTVEMVER